MAQWLAQRYTGATLREIGEAMGGRGYAAVGMAVACFDKSVRNDRRLRQQLHAVARKLNVEMSPL